MGVAAAGLKSAQTVELVGSKKGTIAKYEQFLGAMERFVGQPGDLNFEIFKLINTAATSRLNTGASIGSLGGKPPGFEEIKLPTLKRAPDETDAQFQAKKADFSRQCAEFAANSANRKKLADNLRALQSAVLGSFADSVHPMQQEFRAIQFIATGIDLLEKLNDARGGNPQAGQLFDELSKVGVLGNTNNLKFMKELRTSAFFMEFNLKDLDDKICDTIGNALNQLNQLDPQLSDDEKKAVIDAMKEKLTASRAANFGAEGEAGGVSGMRGRNRAHSGDQARFATDREENIPSFTASRCSDIDLPLLGQLPSAGSNSEQVTAFLQSMQAGGAFVQGKKRMATQTANAQTLPQDRVAILNDPVKFLQDALKATGIHSDRKAAIAGAITGKTGEINSAAQGEFGEIVLKEKPANGRKLSDLIRKDSNGAIESKPSLGSLMKEAGLRSICSVSGTATDIIAGLHAHLGDGNTKKMLQSLKVFVDGGCTDPSKLSDEFKNLFLSVAMYMQSGQYHSAGEVLGGLYCAALTLAYDPTKAAGPDNLDPKNFDQIAPNFQAMWQAFKANPENFFPLSRGDRGRFQEQGPDGKPQGPIQDIVKNLQRQHKKTVERRSQLDAESQKIREDFMEQHPEAQRALNQKRASEAPDRQELERFLKEHPEAKKRASEAP
ncbi:MAG: hypothetical protein LBF34_00170 [Puniceicoccales bacterium]|jgi:hypothetical protein|nr:hypothetical protein [Puniceicoccales bacterium]